MRIGVIGAGRMAQRRVENLPPGCDLNAIWAPNYDSPRYAGKPFDDYIVPDAATVIDMSDLIIVATPHSYLQHYAALTSKRLFVEKPGGIPGDTLLPARYGYNHRFWPGVTYAKRAITAPILHIRGVYGHGNADRMWRMDPELSGGGELLDQGSHLIDLTRFLTGEEVSLLDSRLSVEWWDSPVEDTAHFTLKCGIAMAFHHVSWCEWSPVFSFDIITEAEKITINGFPWTGQTVNVTTRAGNHTTERFYGDQSLRLELQDMLDNGTTGATRRDAQAVLDIITQSYDPR